MEDTTTPPVEVCGASFPSVECLQYRIDNAIPKSLQRKQPLRLASEPLFCYQPPTTYHLSSTTYQQLRLDDLPGAFPWTILKTRPHPSSCRAPLILFCFWRSKTHHSTCTRLSNVAIAATPSDGSILDIQISSQTAISLIPILCV